MLGLVLMVLGLILSAYTALTRFQNQEFDGYKPWGIGIGCGLILLGGWVRQRGKHRNCSRSSTHKKRTINA